MPPSHSGPTAAAPAEVGATLDPRRKRARFRAWHRGTREMDLVMGRFADRELAVLSDAELSDFEHLLELAEADVFAWVTGKGPVPEGVSASLVTRLGMYRGDL